MAARFAVSLSRVAKWLQRLLRTGSVAPGKMGGHRPKILVGERRGWLLGRMAAGAFTLRGLVAELAERGTKGAADTSSTEDTLPRNLISL